MSVSITFIQDEDRLDLSFAGNLDVTVWQDVCRVCRENPPNLKTCIVDLTSVGQIFDSGLAILGLLYRHMSGFGATVIFLSDDSNIKRRLKALVSSRRHKPSLVA